MNQQNFLDAAKGLHLSVSEKASIREALFADMERSAPQGIPHFSNFFRLLSGSIAAIMLFVLCGAVVSYAAESALPGDALYSVKVNLTEPLLLRFNNSIEAKVRVRARLATRRLEEAQNLAVRSQLTAVRVAIVNERLTAHINALEADLKELEMLNKDSSAIIAIETSAEIQAHENVLLRIVSDEERLRVENLLITTRKARKIADEAAVSAHADAAHLTKATADKAEKAIVKARAVQQAAENVILTETLRNAEDDLRASGDTEASVRAKIEKATSALRNAKEVNLMLGIKGRIFLNHDDEPAVMPLLEDSTEQDTGDVKSEQSSVSESLPAAVSSSITTSASASIGASASTSASVGDILNKTDDLIQKTGP